MSRTPKNQNHSTQDAFNTPTRREALKPKLRVLFQTPLNKSHHDSFKKHQNNSSESFSSDINSSKSSINSFEKQMKFNETIVEKVSVENKSIIYQNVDPQLSDYYFNSSDSSSNQNSINTKSNICRKSEPNLSVLCESDSIKNSKVNNRNSLPNNISKCVSMGDLKLSSFSTDSKIFCGSNTSNYKETSSSFENMLTNTSMNFERRYEVDRNWSNEYLIETPLQTLDRNSMSPITKSTQRMPKSMQESIMTPRSRKPVMLLGLNLTCSDTYQSTICSSLNEEDENVLLISHSHSSKHLHRSKSDGDFTIASDNSDNSIIHPKSHSAPESLSSVFKEYLFQRNVVTTSPVDLSFSSQPDDFGSSNDLENITNANLSESLLYCLDGNQPDDMSYVSDGVEDTGSSDDEEDKENVYSLNTSESRKRFATSTITEYGADDETDIDGLHCKKLVLENYELDETEL